MGKNTKLGNFFPTVTQYCKTGEDWRALPWFSQNISYTSSRRVVKSGALAQGVRLGPVRFCFF